MALKRAAGELCYIQMVDTDAIEKKGLVLTRDTTDPTKGALAGAGAYPIGVAYKTTENPLKEGEYLKGQKVAYIRDGEVICQLTENQTITAGDRLVPAVFDTKKGYVKKFSPTAWPATYSSTTAEDIEKEKSTIVGIAQESVTTGADETKPIKVWLTIRHVRT